VLATRLDTHQTTVARDRIAAVALTRVSARKLLNSYRADGRAWLPAGWTPIAFDCRLNGHRLCGRTSMLRGHAESAAERPAQIAEFTGHHLCSADGRACSPGGWACPGHPQKKRGCPAHGRAWRL